MAEQAKYRVIDRPFAGGIRVIDETGSQLGILEVATALEMAQDQDLDLVELDPSSSPPTCKLMDFGKFNYDRRKKHRQSRRGVLKRKEVKLRPKTEEHDFQVKLRKAKAFLEEGHKVLVTLVFRGREQKHPQIGFDLMNKFYDGLREIAKLEKEPSREGHNRLGMILTKR